MSEYAVFFGLDVGKASITRSAGPGRQAGCSTGRWPTTRPRCEQVFTALSAGPGGGGRRPASQIGALPVAVAQAMGIDTAYLPGLAMRRIADLHPGNAKTDARDAFVIADAARTMPHTLRSADIAGPAMADLAVLMGYDDDLRDQVTATTNRLRNLLLRSTPPWNGPWRTTSPTRRCWGCWPATAGRPGCAKPGGPASTPC